jgi:integral membrane protein
MKQLVSIISYLEGISALCLFAVAMPMKYIGGDPELVSIVGAIHGGLFVAFMAILLIGMNKHWNRTALIHGFVAAVVPAGPFLFDGMLISGEYDIDSSSLDTLGP